MTYALYKFKKFKGGLGHYQEYMGELRISPFFIWLFGIEAGMVITGIWVLWIMGAL